MTLAEHDTTTPVRPGAGFAARLATRISEKADAYAQSNTPGRWGNPRLDVARRVAILLVQLGDNDPRVQLIHGATGDPSNCDKAIREMLARAPNVALEAMDAARGNKLTDMPAPGNPHLWGQWLDRESTARLTDDTEYWLRRLAVRSHAAEVEIAMREIDRLKLALKRADTPNEALEELRGQLANAQAETSHLRTQAREAQEAENDIREQLLQAKADLRAALDPTPARFEGPDGLVFTSREAAESAMRGVAASKATLAAGDTTYSGIDPAAPKPKARTRKS